MKTLTIRLTAPLQSYGNEASFSRRTSSDHPSKSAVIGMIAAALGYHRDDPRILTLNDLSFAVRVDQAGKALTDYQTVEWKKDTRKVTYRDYLQDAVFVAALGSDDEQLIDRIAEALKRPKFQLFFGRRSNAPAGTLKVSVFKDDNPVSVLSDLPWEASKWYQKRQKKSELIKNVEIIGDADLMPNKRSSMVKDRVESFDQRNRQHGYRAVAVETINLKNPSFAKDQTEIDDEPETKHDIMDHL